MSNENERQNTAQGDTPRFPWRSADDLTAAIKFELVKDIMAGIVPATVSNFAELHDYVDANCYAGMCDDAKYGHMLDDPDFAEMATNMLNQAQGRIDDWLREGAAAHIDKLGQLLRKLHDRWPDKQFRVAPEEAIADGTGDHFPFGYGIAFIHDDMCIYHPFLSECGRFFVDPAQAYGLDEDAATEIMMANGLKNG